MPASKVSKKISYASQKTASDASAVPSADIQDTSRIAVRRPLALWRISMSAIAFVVFALSTWLALTQKPGPVGMMRRPAWTWEFWRDPIEGNSIKRLPSIDAKLLSVFALKDSSHIHVWVGGRDGVILHSPDGGEHWEQFSPVTRDIRASAAQRKIFDQFSLVMRAEAAVRDDDTKSPNPKGGLTKKNAPNAAPQIQQQQQNAPSSYIAPNSERKLAPTKPLGTTTKLSTRIQKAQPSPPKSANAASAVASEPSISVLTKDIDEIGFEDPQHGYALSGKPSNPKDDVPSAKTVLVPLPATLYETTDGGKSWTSRSYDGKGPNVLLPSCALIRADRTPKGTICAALNGSEAWAVGDAGAIFHTTDAGATWLPQTQGSAGKQLGNQRTYQYPAPWYYVAMVLAIGMATIALKPVPPEAEQPDASDAPGIANVAISDRPLEPGDLDVLGCHQLAMALSAFIRNRNTVPPLTMAVTGEWGSGKSSVMNLLRRDLESYGMRPIWFNAWHNQTEENLFATLLQNLRLQGIPHWWQFDFLPFRWRLLKIRLRRSLLPLLLAACVVAALGGFEITHPHSNPNDIDALQKFFVKLFTAHTSILAIADFLKEPLVFFLAGLATLAATVFSKLKAFGIDPANLLSSNTSRPSISELEKQISVRQQFAAEFRDVTEALGARKMVIFIDDLDRCLPDNVCQVLEAINFVVSSGSCFVVMGLARRPVEACVGLSFSKVAEEMSAPTVDPPRSENPANLRSRFARQYLDKLINIEIPVPAADGRAEGMITASNQPPKPAPRAWRFALTGLAVLAAAFVIYGTFDVARILSAAVQPTVATNPPPTNTQVATQAISTPNAAAGVSNSPVQPAVAAATPAAAPHVVPELISSSAGVTHAATFGPFMVAALIALIGITYLALTRRTGLVVLDSPEFLRALDVWKEFIVRTHATPRAIKRFMNRVRCTAMRVHPVPGGEPTWTTLLRWLSNRSRWLQGISSLLPEAPKADMPAAAGPRESTLVALTAIYDASPNWLTLDAVGDSGWLRAGFLPPRPNDPAVDDNMRASLASTISKHAKQFPTTWPPTSEQFIVFLRLMGTLTTR